MTGYFSVNKFDVVCLSTFLNSKILTDDDNLQMPGYSISQDDHPSNIKRVFIIKYDKSFEAARYKIFTKMDKP